MSVKKLAQAACFLCYLAALSSCGEPRQAVQAEDLHLLELPAGRGGAVSLSLPPSESMSIDTLTGPEESPTAIVTLTPNERARIRAAAIPEAGTDASTRVEYLREAGLDSVSISPGNAGGEAPLVCYFTGDSASVERVWPCGANQLLALRATMAGDSRATLLRYLGDALRTAQRHPWPGLRGVHLTDRTREQILREAGEEDVTPPPRVHHSLGIEVFPTMHRLELVDTITIDFSLTPADSQLSLEPPERAGGEVSILTPIRGDVQQAGGLTVCRADTGRVFKGVYSSVLEGFILRDESSAYPLTGQVKLNLSFCCGAWLHPWSRHPSDYSVRFNVPPGYTVYAPLIEVDRISTDTSETVELATPEGGIRGPIAWAVGYLSSRELRSGSAVVLPGGADPGNEDSTRVSDTVMEVQTAIDWAVNLNRFCWNYLGFESARLDYILIGGEHGQVLQAGPGCLFISPDLLLELAEYPSWPDSLRRGSRPKGADVVAAAAAAILSRSTHLDPALERALCGWSVLRYYQDNLPADAAGSALMRQAFLRYYLYSTESLGGTEYAIADPRLLDSPLRDPVLLGKAPLVLDLLHSRLQRFDLGLQRALGSLRHSGNSFLRLHSAIRISAGSSDDELFWKWLTYPGIPQLTTTWSDSAGVLYVELDQRQPGLGFPMEMDSVLVTFKDGSSAGLSLSRRQGGNLHVAVLPDTFKEVLSVQVNPDWRIPADVLNSSDLSE